MTRKTSMTTSSRTLAAVVAMALGTVACGTPEQEFVDTYTTSVCTHELDCGDPADNRFRGVLDVEDCEGITKPEVYAWGNGCRYRGGQAAQCLADLTTLTCPGQGGLAPIPASCESVYVNCSDVVDTDTSDPGDGGGEDTGSGGDTDDGSGGDTDT